MQTEDHDLIQAFASIARESANMGQHSFSAWVAEPDKYMKRGRYSLPIDTVLRSVPESERNKIADIVGFFSSMAVRYFIAALEEGKNGYTFELSMHDKESGQEASLINDSEDLNLRGLV